MISTFLVIFIVLCIVAVLYWGINQLTLPPNFKVAIIVISAILLLLWLLSMVNGHRLTIS